MLTLAAVIPTTIGSGDVSDKENCTIGFETIHSPIIGAAEPKKPAKNKARTVKPDIPAKLTTCDWNMFQKSNHESKSCRPDLVILAGDKRVIAKDKGDTWRSLSAAEKDVWKAKGRDLSLISDKVLLEKAAEECMKFMNFLTLC